MQYHEKRYGYMGCVICHTSLYMLTSTLLSAVIVTMTTLIYDTHTTQTTARCLEQSRADNGNQ